MSYTITLTDGSIYAVIADGTIDTTSSMTLVGKNYAGYGQFINDDIIRLLENGSNTTAPGAPLTGQLWWNKTTGTMQVYNGSAFKVISGATSSTTAPSGSTSVPGDLWYDSVNAQLNVYSGSAWIIVGPAYTAGTGTTGAIVATITDNTAISHVVVELYVQDSIVGIISKDAAFTPQIAIPGFTTVRPGITLATSISGVNQYFQGTATNSQSLGGVAAANYLQNSGNQSITGGNLNVGGAISASGNVNIGTSYFLGNGALLTGVITSVANINNGTSNVTVVSSGGNISVGVGGTSNVVVWANTGEYIGGLLSVTGNITTTGVLTVNSGNAATAIINGGGNVTGNIGSSTKYFNKIFAQATTALYADVAERFASDEIYEPGTVVELGGTAEITKVRSDASESVFGVISTRPAFMMNGGAGDDDTHPPVAMTGRVPVTVTGIVNKGDRLISAGNGLARSARPGEATAFNVIGRALTEKTSSAVGTVEAIVTIK